ncbi:MAG TPA: hypothetical protein VMZ22_10835 [Acidimicrobiales bacterium]|nr:hypothetical protein [Acidimicrobiales bacterium]
MTVKPETFAGGAAARALDLSILGQKLTLGDTVANIVKGVGDTGNSTYLAKAVGTGQLSLLGNTTATSAVTSEGAQNKPASCAALALPAEIASILSVGIACGSSTASIQNGLLNAVASGQVGDIDLSVNNLLATLGLDGTVEGVGVQVGGLVSTLLGVTQELGLPTENLPNVGDLLSDVIGSIAKTKTLEVLVGDAKSETVSTANTVTAKAHSAAVDIKILPTPTLGGVVQSTPLVQIIIGEASAKATYDRLTGKPLGDPTFDPAIVRVKGLVPTLLLGADSEKGIAVTLGQDLTLLAGTPLESRIILGAGKIVDDGVFGKKAVADGVAVELLKGISGGIVLNLAHAEAGAIANLPQTRVLDTPSIDIARGAPTSLPRTGAEAALPLALAGALIAAVAIRRFRMVAATPAK